jgi:nucleotide-binding universal stress UspA family protein
MTSMGVRLLQALFVVAVVLGLLGLVVISIEDWDDWLFLGLFVFGLAGLVLALAYGRFPAAPWRRRGYKRDSDRRVRAREAESGTTGILRTIAVGTDGSETASRAVDAALDLAEHFGARLVVGSCYAPVDEADVRSEAKEAPQDIQRSTNPPEDVEAILQAVAKRASERGVETTGDARMGRPAEVLCQIAAEHDADVLVVGSKGMHRHMLGSVPNTVSHLAPCSVMVVKTT